MNLAIRQHRLTPLVTVTVAALVFAVLLLAVRLQWAPLESADHGAAASINSLIAGTPPWSAWSRRSPFSAATACCGP